MLMRFPGIFRLIPHGHVDIIKTRREFLYLVDNECQLSTDFSHIFNALLHLDNELIHLHYSGRNRCLHLLHHALNIQCRNRRLVG